MITNHKEILTSYRCFPDYNSSYIFSDKIRTERLAGKLGISCPQSIRLCEIDEMHYDQFPSIAKWNKRIGGEPFKTKLIGSSKMLRQAKAKYENMSEIIVQKYIRSESNVGLSYAGIFSKGVEVAGIAVHQERQYPTGLSSYVQEYTGQRADQVRSIAQQILSATRYSGWAEVEFRYDDSKDKIYLIEVNPRACGWIKIMKRKYGISLFNDKTCGITHSCKPSAWINVLRDLCAIMDMAHKNRKKVNYQTIFKDYMSKPITDIFEFDDLKPFLSQFRKLTH